MASGPWPLADTKESKKKKRGLNYNANLHDKSLNEAIPLLCALSMNLVRDRALEILKTPHTSTFPRFRALLASDNPTTLAPILRNQTFVFLDDLPFLPRSSNNRRVPIRINDVLRSNLFSNP